MSNGNSAEASTSPSPAPSSISNNAPKFGTLVPNRVFVGGISGNTTEQDLLELFTKYGKVKATKVISDRAGVSKGYGFVTFETEEEARKLTQEADNIMLKDRKLNIAPAIKKQVNDIGYIKPYSPRLVDGNSTASVLGSNGTVFFGGNGTTYAYTSPMPMLANPSEYHQAVAGVPTPTAAHPTFPQVPQTGAHPAVSAATQAGGAPNAAGYPAQFVYPQTMYFPQQYQQFQSAAALQPQWPSSAAQWRWVSPGAYPQPECSSLSCETEESCAKGNQSSSDSFFNFPPPCVHSSSSSYAVPPPACAHCWPPPPPPMGPVTSSTTNTTTTTTAVIGSSSLLKTEGTVHQDEGSLHINPLLPEVSEKVLEQNYKGKNEGSLVTLNGEANNIPKSTYSTLARVNGHKGSRKASLLNGHRKISESSPDSEDKGMCQSNIFNSPAIKGCPIRRLKLASQTPLRKTKMDTESFHSSTPSPDNLAPNLSLMNPIPAYGIPPLQNNSSSATGDMVWPLPHHMNWPAWCPQHNLGGPPHMMPPMWNGPQTSPLNGSSKKSLGSNSPPRSCGSPQNSLLNGCSPINIHSGEDSLIGKPVFKMDPPIFKHPYGMMNPPGSTLMMVPWYQYGPPLNQPPWYQWAPYANPYHPGVVPVNHFCSTHLPTPVSDTPENALTFQFPSKTPFSSTLQQMKVGISPPTGGVKARKNEKTFYDFPTWSMPPTPDTPSYQSPVRSRMPPHLVEPVRCVRRLTQLPDDRCALLPVSPPMIPLQNVSGNLS